jgi:hypothetical protein
MNGLLTTGLPLSGSLSYFSLGLALLCLLSFLRAVKTIARQNEMNSKEPLMRSPDPYTDATPTGIGARASTQMPPSQSGTYRSFGAVRIAGLALLGALVLVGASGGFIGSAIQAKQAERQYPPLKLGCDDPYSNCPESQWITVVDKIGSFYFFGYNSKSVGYVVTRQKMCTDYKEPFEVHDRIKSIRVEDRFDCWSLRPYGAYVVLGTINGKTDSEIEHEAEKSK